MQENIFPLLPKLPFLNIQTPKDLSLSIALLVLIGVLAVAPSIVICLTCFLRIFIVLSFTRLALGMHEAPPLHIISCIALFLTFFIMSPTILKIYSNAILPLYHGNISQKEGLRIINEELRKFMFKHTREKDLDLFLSVAKLKRPKDQQDIPTYVLIPAFITSELTKGFKMGVILFLPFVVIDMIVASVLMAMGMIMLPPAMISLPFKVVLFVTVDGWHLVVKSLVDSFK